MSSAWAPNNTNAIIDAKPVGNEAPHQTLGRESGRCVGPHACSACFHVCGCRCVSPVVFIRGRGLTFTSARALVRAQIDGPDLLPTDTWDHQLTDARTTRREQLGSGRTQLLQNHENCLLESFLKYKSQPASLRISPVSRCHCFLCSHQKRGECAPRTAPIRVLFNVVVVLICAHTET